MCYLRIGHGRKPQMDAATQAYNGLGGSYPPYMDSLSSQSHTDHTITASVLPPTLLPCPQNFQLQHLIATPSRQCRVRQNLPGWATNQADGRHSPVVSYPEDAVTSGSSRRKNVHLSQELDFKPGVINKLTRLCFLCVTHLYMYLCVPMFVILC